MNNTYNFKRDLFKYKIIFAVQIWQPDYRMSDRPVIRTKWQRFESKKESGPHCLFGKQHANQNPVVLSA